MMRFDVLFLYQSPLLFDLNTTPAFSSTLEHDEKFTELVQQFVNKENFMGNILVAKEGKILFDKSFGYQRIDSALPLKSSSTFRIPKAVASLSFTGIVATVRSAPELIWESINALKSIWYN